MIVLIGAVDRGEIRVTDIDEVRTKPPGDYLAYLCHRPCDQDADYEPAKLETEACGPVWNHYLASLCSEGGCTLLSFVDISLIHVAKEHLCMQKN